MTQDLHDIVRAFVQAEAERACDVLRTPFRLEVGPVRSEDGYFKAEVRPVGEGVSGTYGGHDAVRFVLASVEQEIEERYQGLRLMLLPAAAKRRVAHRKASTRRKAG